jgi:DNA uptake protein ComE-like DNA-binding protein
VRETGPDRTTDADAWLPEGAKPRPAEKADESANGGAPAAADSKAPNSEALEWLPAERNGVAAEPAKPEPEPPAAEPERPAPEAKPDPPVPEPAPVQETKGDDTQLKETEAALAEARSRIAELEGALQQREAELSKKLDEREAEFAQALRERDQALKQREAELESQLSQGYEKREADLNREFDHRQVELEKQLAVLEDRLNSREAELRDRATQREAKLIHRIEDLQSQLADAKLGLSDTQSSKRSRKGGAGKDGALDLNLASFEELRELGLSVTQSARVIAYRDTRGGFDSLEELSEIPGLPKDTRVALSSRLRL